MHGEIKESNNKALRALFRASHSTSFAREIEDNKCNFLAKE